MTQKNRPEGWVTLKAKYHPLHCLNPDACVGDAFEAGADALIEAGYRLIPELTILSPEEIHLEVGVNG